MYPIFSYGAPRFSLGNLSVAFSNKNPAGTIEFEPKEDNFETLSGKQITNFKGYRAKITLKLYNLAPDDYQKHLQLLNIINTSRSFNVPILLQPRFSTGATLSLWVRAKSSISYKEITNLNAGQTVDLNFESDNLLSEMPLLVNLPGFLLLDSSHYLLLDSSGHKLILPYQNYTAIDITQQETFT